MQRIASGLACAFFCLAGSPALAADSLSTAPLFAANVFDLDNKPVAFDSYRGRPLIVNFWARWCGPCRVEIPELVEIKTKHMARGIEVIGMNIENDALPVRDFAKAYDVNYPVFLTREKGIALMQALGNKKTGLPFTVVLNRQGVIVASKLGAMTKADLEAATEAALK